MYLITYNVKIQAKGLRMSRPGITYQEVANAAIQLQGKNENPTVDRIREILETGSKSTIARYLKEWKSKTDHSAGFDGVPQELTSIVKGLWERLKAVAEQQITHHQQETDRSTTEIKQSFVQEQKRASDLQTQLIQLEEQLHQEKYSSQILQQAIEEEKRSNVKLTERNDQITRQLTDQKSETERLHQLLSHVQANLEHYQASIQKLREEQILNSENQKTTYEREISSLKQDLIDATHGNIQTQRELDQAESQVRLLSQQADKYSKEYSILQNQFHEKMINESMLQQKCNQLDQFNKNHQNKTEEQSVIIIEFEKKLAISSNQISLLQQSLNDAQDKINILRDEKLFLAQEKSHLEGQLKYLEEKI
jgi:chromosome segregation ATPase